MIVFETERLLVRYLRDDDFEALYALCSDPEIIRYMDNGEPLTDKQTKAWIKLSQENYQKRGYGCFAITSRPEGQLIGFGGLSRPVSNPQVEIIYAFKQSCWGKGLASEFIRSMLATSFERWQIPRIEATIDPSNPASSKAAEKAGMSFVRSGFDKDGRSTLWYALDHPALSRQ